jgi:hypothetical protein
MNESGTWLLIAGCSELIPHDRWNIEDGKRLILVARMSQEEEEDGKNG